MPVTMLSHQAVVLPLKMRWPHRFSGLGLCLGSMAPDLEFIGRMTDDWIFSHTMGAQLWFTIPVSLVLHWLLTALIFPVLLPFLRDHPKLRLHDLAALSAPVSFSEWSRAALSAWLGGMSHVVLDGITHGNHSGWLVPWFPLLRTPVPHFGQTIPLYDVLQLWLTLIFAAFSLSCWRRITGERLLWSWRAKTPRELPRQPRNAGFRLLLLTGMFALIGCLLGLNHQHTSAKSFAAAIAFGTIDLTCVGLLVAALRLRAAQHAAAPRGTLARGPQPRTSPSSSWRPPPPVPSLSSCHGAAP